MSAPLLKVENLSVDFRTPGGTFHAVKQAGFTINKGQTLALFGESGSGKSVTALSITQLLPYPLASHPQGSSIRFEGEELIGKPDDEIRKLRGRRIGMIFQEPQTALNPLHSIEKQVKEMLFIHRKIDGKQAQERVLELFDLVGLGNLKDRLQAYPHQLSGGQRQRVMIAMALANNPDLLIADEPTTALDVTIQAQILELLDSLKQKLDMALLLITHDLTIVEKMADRVCVMKAGEIVEQNDAARLFARPQHDYTKMLLSAQPKSKILAAKADAPVIMEGVNIKVHFPKQKSFLGKAKSWVKAVDDISLTARKGQTIGVVGESGSGKTTLGLALLRLINAQGRIVFQGRDILGEKGSGLKALRADMQIVFQDPFSSLSPRMSVSDIIAEGLKIHRPEMTAALRDETVVSALADVDMDPETRHRYPHEFSGGQRQRISIARAMVLQPEFVVLDEPTSALDLSVQAQIIEMLHKLQKKHELSYLFISHDLRVVRAMAHELIVMQDGKVIESGPAAEIFENPKTDYTKRLLEASLNLKTLPS